MANEPGELITETLDFDGGRNVTVFVPPQPADSVVFTTDGQVIAPWGQAAASPGRPSTMFVGVHRVADETARLREYSLGFDRERFAAHEKFFVEHVRGWARSRFGIDFPADRNAVYGVSAGGELALAMGVRHPDIYGAVFSASPGGGYKPSTAMPASLPRFYLVAGSQEPFFLENATRWAEALRDAGAEVVMAERPGAHGDPFWQIELPRMISWAFGQRM